MKKQRVLAIFGTRPEAVKMCPVINQLQKHQHEIETCIVVTGQHRSMLDQILRMFNIKPDYDLDIMRSNQTLTGITVRSLEGLEAILQKEDCQLVMVQGDTTTAFAGGLAAFYHRVPIAHIEAGLRTRQKYNPYPEEINRHFIDVLADLCFVPTIVSEQALLSEGVGPERIFVTGNTVIDALLSTVSDYYSFDTPSLQAIDFKRRPYMLLVTVHRRENHGKPLLEICAALKQLTTSRSDIQIVLPVHLNPNVFDVVHDILGDQENIYLTDPLNYPDFVNLMARSHVILTDSGGVQEEAPSLGKPVLVMRETTERPEAVSAGTARLVGTKTADIIMAVNELLDYPDTYHQMAQTVNPYGDGQASTRIVQAIRYYLGFTQTRPEEFISETLLSQQPSAC